MLRHLAAGALPFVSIIRTLGVLVRQREDEVAIHAAT
jgi:hypothetical protein